jgi:DNA-binding response OmpR family regulator
MGEPVKVVAVFAASQALSSILAAMLAATPNLRVRMFESLGALQTYMRLSAVDLLVCDFDSETAPAGVIARALRFDDKLVKRDFQIIALASKITPNMKQASIANGIDEVIVKPMSPRYLLERVFSRLRHTSPQVTAGPYQGPERRGRLPMPATAMMAAHGRRGDNVIPLFGNRALPT